MFNLFSSKPVLDEGTRQWLFDSYAWALEHFGSDIFLNSTQLITPTDQFFPDRADAPEQMAALLLQRIQQHAAMQNWPCQAQPVSCNTDPQGIPAFTVNGSIRGENSQISTEDGQAIAVPYDPAALASPEQMIVGLVHNLAILITQACPALPPGGDEYRGPATDLLSIFMGFGLFMTNNAFAIKRGCASCAPPSVQVMGDLTQDEMSYALAIFCELKGIEYKTVHPHLRKNLRGFFKKALKEVSQQQDEISRLKSLLN